jgi:hypothetical protein
MFWRFLPTSEPDVDAVIVRDTDSRVAEREKNAVDAWLESGKGFHIMRDHPQHYALILGGMWGARGGRLPDTRYLLMRWRARRLLTRKTCFDRKGMDQVFLEEMVYPRIQDDVCIHSDFIRFEGEEVSPFPTIRKTQRDFVGRVYQGQ